MEPAQVDPSLRHASLEFLLLIFRGVSNIAGRKQGIMFQLHALINSAFKKVKGKKWDISGNLMKNDTLLGV